MQINVQFFCDALNATISCESFSSNCRRPSNVFLEKAQLNPVFISLLARSTFTNNRLSSYIFSHFQRNSIVFELCSSRSTGEDLAASNAALSYLYSQFVPTNLKNSFLIFDHEILTFVIQKHAMR